MRFRIDLAQAPEGHKAAQKTLPSVLLRAANAQIETNVGSTSATNREMPMDKATALPHLKTPIASSTFAGQGRSSLNGCDVACCAKFFRSSELR